MKDSFQNDKYEEDSKKSEGIGNIGKNNENNKINKIDISKLINNNRNYYIFIKENNLNQGKFSKNNSINLNYQNTIPNIYSIPFQGINEPQNFDFNKIQNFNTSNSPLFNANQNFYQNQMFAPNNNYATSNYLNQIQNIFPIIKIILT